MDIRSKAQSGLSLAVAAASLGLLAQSAAADGFLEDSKASLTLRNFYINSDNRNGSNAPNKQEEWGQGFLLNYQSGFTEGTVGVGVDALGLLGVRLDSGKGTHYNPTSSSYSGTVFPTDGDGRAVDDFSSLGLTAKAILVTLPAALLLLDWWPLGRLRTAGTESGRGVPLRRLGALAIEKLPLLALSAAAAVTALLTQARTRQSLDALPPLERLTRAATSYALSRTRTPATISPIPKASREANLCLKRLRDRSWANRISINARVRTLAAVSSAKARNHICEANAPVKPANREGRQRRKIAISVLRSSRYR